jgi:hypothetical protein
MTPSAVPGKFDAVFTDTETRERLEVVWVSEEVTRNILGDSCWLYDGEVEYPCEGEAGLNTGKNQV